MPSGGRVGEPSFLNQPSSIICFKNGLTGVLSEKPHRVVCVLVRFEPSTSMSVVSAKARLETSAWVSASVV